MWGKVSETFGGGCSWGRPNAVCLPGKPMRPRTCGEAAVKRGLGVSAFRLTLDAPSTSLSFEVRSKVDCMHKHKEMLGSCTGALLSSFFKAGLPCCTRSPGFQLVSPMAIMALKYRPNHKWSSRLLRMTRILHRSLHL